MIADPFEPLFEVFKSYCDRNQGHFDPLQAELAREAALLLRDLDLLRERVVDGTTRALVNDEAKIAEYFELMRDDLMKDPITAQIFTNLNVTRRTVMSGYAFDPIRSPEMESLIQRALRLDTEFYYYKAHRLLTVLSRLPKLRNLKCDDIAIIRNQLLEHPEKKSSRVTHPGFALAPDVGPIIKGMRRGDQKGIHEDQGFAKNHAKLLNVLEVGLKAAS